MGFAPYPGKVSPRTVTAFWLLLALACIGFWVFLVLHRGEWYEFRAWILFVTALYVLYWRSGLRAARLGASEDGER